MKKAIVIIALLCYCPWAYGQLRKIETLYRTNDFLGCWKSASNAHNSGNKTEYLKIKTYQCKSALILFQKTNKLTYLDNSLALAQQELKNDSQIRTQLKAILQHLQDSLHQAGQQDLTKKYLLVSAKDFRDTTPLYAEYFPSFEERMRRDRLHTREELLAYAQLFLNIPYKWAGADSSGFDCSGLVQRVFTKVGYPMAHGSKDQAELGKEISRAEIKPGDLVFYGKKYDTGRYKIDHVSIVYQCSPDSLVVIHSTSKGVNIQSITNTDYWGKKLLFYRNIIDHSKKYQ